MRRFCACKARLTTSSTKLHHEFFLCSVTWVICAPLGPSVFFALPHTSLPLLQPASRERVTTHSSTHISLTLHYTTVRFHSLMLSQVDPPCLSVFFTGARATTTVPQLELCSPTSFHSPEQKNRHTDGQRQFGWIDHVSRCHIFRRLLGFTVPASIFSKVGPCRFVTSKSVRYVFFPSPTCRQ